MTAIPGFYEAAFSSKNGKWDTPDSLIADLAPIFRWDLDVCAERANVCKHFYSEREDGLQQEWRGLCWMNPPYGDDIGAWVDKASAFGSARARRYADDVIVCLLPARTDTDWFQRNFDDISQIVFIKGRLKFGSTSHWIAHYQEKIADAYKLLGQGSSEKYIEKAGALSKKIGGRICSNDTRERMLDYFSIVYQDRAAYKMSNWVESEHLKPDGAPFPSMFVVFGDLRLMQLKKLSSYGSSILFPSFTRAINFRSDVR